MKSILAVIGTVTFVILAWVAAANASASNNAMKACLAKFNYTIEQFDTFNWNNAAKCHSDYREIVISADLTDMRNFLDANPRYRFPGQSMNRCWGKPREMPFESAYIERTGEGFRAGVSYKDTLPAGCYETGPWDNRHEK